MVHPKPARPVRAPSSQRSCWILRKGRTDVTRIAAMAQAGAVSPRAVPDRRDRFLCASHGIEAGHPQDCSRIARRRSTGFPIGVVRPLDSCRDHQSLPPSASQPMAKPELWFSCTKRLCGPQMCSQHKSCRRSSAAMSISPSTNSVVVIQRRIRSSARPAAQLASVPSSSWVQRGGRCVVGRKAADPRTGFPHKRVATPEVFFGDVEPIGH